MNQQPTTTDKQRVLKGDFLFACSMFIVGCIFLTGLIAAPFWDFAQTQKIISANSTSTAFVVATQQAHVTATAAAHAMEQTKYEFIDYFDDNTNHWMEGSSNDEYAADETKVAGGVYAWDIYQVRKPFISWENFLEAKKVEDFDVYVDSRIKATKGTISDVCSGFIFRTASADWEQGAYVFSACNNSYFNVKYYKHGEWDAISGKTYSNAIQIDDWNRVEISARGNHFTLIINNEVVFKMTDDRLPKGGLGLFIDVDEKKPVSILFDNFGFQSR